MFCRNGIVLQTFVDIYTGVLATIQQTSSGMSIDVDTKICDFNTLEREYRVNRRVFFEVYTCLQH